MTASSDEDEEAGAGPVSDDEVACDAAGAVGEVAPEPETIVDLSRRTRKKRVMMHTSRARAKRDREQDDLEPPPMFDSRFDGTSYMQALRDHPQGLSGRWIPRDVKVDIALPNAKSGANSMPDISSEMHDGCVFGCGNNASGQLGLGVLVHRRLFVLGLTAINCPDSMAEQTRLQGIHSYAAQPWKGPLVAAAAGESHSMICTESGTFVTGSGQFGTLGLGSRMSIEPAFVPIPMLIGVPVRSVACGYAHSVLSTAEEVPRTLSWGSNSHGQLGLTLEVGAIVSTPSEVGALAGRGVHTVACGRQHTLAVTEAGELWTCGRHCSGQLGLGGTMPHVNEPARVPIPAGEAVAAASAGSHHSLVLLRSGTVLGSGYNSHGQLGRYLPASAAAPPLTQTGAHAEETEVKEDREWVGGTVRVPVRVKLAVGEVGVLIGCGALHSVVVTESRDRSWTGRRVYCCGAGGGGQLGNESRGNRADLTSVPGLDGRDVRGVACGMFATLAVVQMDGSHDGCSLVAWGMDVFGRNVRKLSSITANSSANSSSSSLPNIEAPDIRSRGGSGPVAGSPADAGSANPCDATPESGLSPSATNAPAKKGAIAKEEADGGFAADVDCLAEACGEMGVCSSDNDTADAGGSAGKTSHPGSPTPEHCNASPDHASPDQPTAAGGGEATVGAVSGIWTQRSSGRGMVGDGKTESQEEMQQAAASIQRTRQERRGKDNSIVSSEADVVLVLPPLARLQLARVAAGPCSNHTLVLYRRRLPWEMARVVWAGVLKASPEECHLAWLPRETLRTSMLASRVLQLAAM